MTDGLFDDFLSDDDDTESAAAAPAQESEGATEASAPQAAVDDAAGAEEAPPPDAAAEGGEEMGAGEDVAAAEDGHAFIWFTDIQLSEVLDQLKMFFSTFAREGEPPLYPELCRAAIASNEWYVNMDCSNLARFSLRLYNQLVNYPSQIIMIMDVALREVYKEYIAREGHEHGDDDTGDEDEDDGGRLLSVRPFNLRRTVSMRDLGPDDIDRLVAVSGMVVRASSIIPNMRTAFFKCTECGHTEEVDVDARDRIAEPAVCANCTSRGSMETIHNRCTFADKQVVRLQETPESIPQGETPQTVTLYAFDSLVDAVKPGDRIEVTGVFRAEPVRASSRKRTVKALYKTCL